MKQIKERNDYFMLRDLVKGVIIVSVAIPVSIIGMNVTGRLINKYSKKTN